jgi:hypothetical protein
VIKDVHVRDAAMLASCGDDACVRVCDLRCAGAAPLAATIADAHGGAAVHTVRWHPGTPHLLLTAGLDTAVRLWDLRKSDAPAVEYRGHVPYALPRYRAIHRPAFYAGGAAVVTCGERRVPARCAASCVAMWYRWKCALVAWRSCAFVHASHDALCVLLDDAPRCAYALQTAAAFLVKGSALKHSLRALGVQQSSRANACILLHCEAR